MIDPDLVARARLLCGHATPGPWRWVQLQQNGKRILLWSLHANDDRGVLWQGVPTIGPDNRRFVAEARTLLPLFLDAYTTLTGESGNSTPSS